MIKSKYLIIIATIALFLGAGVGASGIFSQTATSGTAPGMTADASYQASGIEPNPVMNTNITWSNFYSGWNPLEYSNGTTNLTLQTNMSSFYKNPITVNPMNISAQALNGNITGINLGATTNWTTQGAQGGAVFSAISKSGHTISTTLNESASATQGNSGPGTMLISKLIPTTSLPSSNANYDYITVAWNMEGTRNSAVSTRLEIFNTTTSSNVSNVGKFVANSTHGANNNQYISIPLSMLKMPISATQGYHIALDFLLPEGTASYTMNMGGIAITQNQLSLGTMYSNGTLIKATQMNSSSTLHTFNPNFNWQDITNGGYTVATSQVLQNITTSQSSINSGNYIEQVTYQGSLSLPTAPDLSYSNSNITMPITLQGSQFIVANLNGVSFTSTLSGMKNGTLAFGTVNPNSQNTIVLEVDYTASQWNSVSNAPSFWTDPLGAIEYYWYISLGVLLGAIGLGTGIGAKANGFRVRK